MFEIYSVEYNDEGTVDVTLKQGDLFVRCEDIALWDEGTCDDAVFEEWLEYAEAGEQGFKMWRAIGVA